MVTRKLITESDLTPREADVLRAVRAWAGEVEVASVTERRYRGTSNNRLNRSIDARVSALPAHKPGEESGFRWEFHGTDGTTGVVYVKVETLSRRTGLGFAFTVRDRS